ncbi:AF4/FMR2 family member 4-like isoform X2 [Erpetoichthys calabaricus]|uniref:AF4/FMR2 family member 4-like isoform X2 n=1 Tax=Erpetoichthys calabaricus TaxID=27687 RepID=UPI0022342E9B|nr:AF4/FMR2 family member 4-like isoform X2 [Erpetoichthys calabaricus]
METKPQGYSEFLSRPASPSTLTHQTNTTTTCEQNDQGQSAVNESDTTGERSKPPSETMSGVQNNTNEEPSKDPEDEVEKLTDSFPESQNKHLSDVPEKMKKIENKQQDKESEAMETKPQGYSEVSSRPASPSTLTHQTNTTTTCEQNDQGQSAVNESDTTGERSKPPSEMMSGVQNNTNEEPSKDPENEVETLTDSFPESQNKHLSDVPEKMKKIENKQQDKESEAMETKPQGYSEFLSRPASPSTLTHQTNTTTTCEQNDQGQSAVNESDTTGERSKPPSETMSGVQNNTNEEPSKDPENEVETLTDSFPESQNKHLSDVPEKMKKIENKQQDKESEDMEIKPQGYSEVSSRPASPSALTHQMNTTTTFEQNDQGQSAVNESDTTGERSKPPSETMSGVQNNTSEEPSKDAEDSPGTDVKESNKMFYSAYKLIDDMLQEIKVFKDSLKKKIETTTRDTCVQPADPQTESLSLSFQGELVKLTDSLLKSQNKQFCALRQKLKTIENKQQDKESKDMETKPQGYSEVSSRPASPSALTHQMNTTTTCEQNDQGQSTVNESDTTGERSKPPSETTSGVQNNTSEEPSKDPEVQTNADEFQDADWETIKKDDVVPHLEDSPGTDVKESNKMFNSAYKLIDDMLQEIKVFKDSLEKKIETTTRDTCVQPADPQTESLSLSFQGELVKLIDSLLKSQNKQFCALRQKLKTIENKQQVMKKESKGQAFLNLFSPSHWFPDKVLLIEVVGSDKTAITQKTFLNELSKQLKDHKMTINVAQLDNESSNLVLLFCPVVSRIGTDIGVALKKVSSNKKIILVVMHHTPKPEYRVADSSRLVEQENVVLTVDYLFHETIGLLNCNLNNESSQKLLNFICSFMRTK